MSDKINKNNDAYSLSGHVLIVDSSMTMVEIYAEVLQSVGTDCRKAYDGNEAWKILLNSVNNKSFDILIMAWELPGLSAVELMRRVRAHRILAELPIIIFSEHVEKDIWVKIPNRYKCDLLHKHDVQLLAEHIRLFILN